jgi:hypothetical protein
MSNPGTPISYRPQNHFIGTAVEQVSPFIHHLILAAPQRPGPISAAQRHPEQEILSKIGYYAVA